MRTRNSRVSKNDLNLAQSELEHARKQISDLTLSIIRAIKERQDLARKVARIKDAYQLPIENLNVEKKIKTNVEEYATKIGLEKNPALQVAEILISSSKIAQRKEIFSKKIIPFLEKREIEKVSVFGAGRMGGWFAHYFKALGREVFLYDKNVNFSMRRATELGCKFVRDFRSALRSDLILVAVPIAQTNTEIRRIQHFSKEMAKCKAIIEISSVKEGVSQGLEQRKIPVVSIHPLFGASASEFAQNSMALVGRGGSNKDDDFAFQLVKGIFPQYDIVRSDAEEHDKQMALMLSLPHALALIFAEVLAENASLAGQCKFDTPSFSAMKEIATKVLSESSDVYYEIQSANKFTTLVLKQLDASVKKLSNYIEQEDRLKFKKLFDASAKVIKTRM